MSLSLPKPSSRLVAAAEAERAHLARHRHRLGREREKLVADLRQLDDALAAVDRRLSVLSSLAELPHSVPAAGDLAELSTQAATSGAGSPTDSPRAPTDPPQAPTDSPQASTTDESRTALRGPAIREAAVRVLIGQPEHIEALHYRRWFELVEQSGYAVAGKDPVAVFLTQVSRSPVVRKASQPGVYEVDRQAPLRIRQRLERLQSELREVTLTPNAPIELASIRARRHELDLAISQQERALEEALRVLRGDDQQSQALGATSMR